MIRSEKGMALVLTLMILVIITALVVEFCYDVYTTTSSLYNWKDSQNLSSIARSGITLSVKTINDAENLYSYTYPGRVDMPVDNIVDGFSGTLTITIEDENSRLNLNSLIYPNGTLNPDAYFAFRRLLKYLSIDEEIADWVADWIDKDSEPRVNGSEEGAKNAPLDSTDELLLIKKITPQIFEILSPYVTVYGVNNGQAHLININTASKPVIMSLDDRITEDLARRIVQYRELEPFRQISDLMKVAGFEGSLGQSLMNRIIVKASNFHIHSVAEQDKIKRIIECVIAISGNSQIIRFWKET
ncbi:MAG: type II secretion system minor pseudopilin GspK [Dissulfurispiraceae bacterium]